MDFDTTFGNLRKRKEQIQDDAAALGRREIEIILDELNKQFQRHNFYFVQGMGTQVVFCDGNILGDHFASRICGESCYSRYKDRKVLRYVQERVDRIIEIAELIDDEFDAQIGNIGESRE